jgi:hypothetical protein
MGAVGGGLLFPLPSFLIILTGSIYMTFLKFLQLRLEIGVLTHVPEWTIKYKAGRQNNGFAGALETPFLASTQSGHRAQINSILIASAAAMGIK